MDKTEPMSLLDLIRFYDGSAKPEFDGAHPTIRINGDDFARILSGVSALLSENARLRELTGGKNNALDQLVRVAAENARLREALEYLMAERSGMPKRCGHDFDCICAGDKARAALSAQEDA